MAGRVGTSMKYKVIKGTNIYRAITEQPDGGSKVVAIFGKVRELAEKNIIFLDGKPATDMWIVLIPEQEASSHELVNVTACKDYIERYYEKLREEISQ